MLDGFRDFLWNRLHISSSAAVFMVVMALLMIAVFKIDNNNQGRFARFQDGACKIIDQANQSQSQTKGRIEDARVRYLKQANAEQSVADVWITALKQSSQPVPVATKKLVTRLIDSQEQLAKQDRSFAADDSRQAKAVQPIVIPGC